MKLNIFASVVLVLAAILFAYSIMTYREAAQMKSEAQAWVSEIDVRINESQKKLEEMRLQCAQWTYGTD